MLAFQFIVCQHAVMSVPNFRQCCHVSSEFPPMLSCQFSVNVGFSPAAWFRSPFSISLSLWPGPAQTYHAAHCGLGRPAEEWRGDHFLSDSARPVFRDWRDATHSQRDCSKLSGTGQISTWIPWNEENLTKLLFGDKRDLLTFFQNILFYSFVPRCWNHKMVLASRP